MRDDIADLLSSTLPEALDREQEAVGRYFSMSNRKGWTKR